MKCSISGLLKSAIITLSLGAATLCSAQTTVAPPILNMSPPQGTIFPPTQPTLESDDSYITYHYAVGGSPWWSAEEVDYGCANSLACGVEEKILHYKTNGTITASARSTDYYAEVDYTWCPAPPQPLVSFTNLTSTCSDPTNGGCFSYIAPPINDQWYAPYGGGVTGYPPPPPHDPDNDITQPLTTNNTSSGCGGTIITGGSAYSWDIPTGGTQGYSTACGLTPNMYFSGEGSVFEMDLTITTNCTPDPSLFSANLALPEFTFIPGSQNPMTPSGGGFDGGGNFGFAFSVPASNSYSIYASTDLVSWSSIGQISATTNGTFTDTNTASFQERFYLVSTNGMTNSSDVYGFVSINVTTNGAMISDPLLGDNGMSIGTLLPSMPNGTTIELYSAGNWNTAATFSSGSWDNPNVALTPGNGAKITPTSNITIPFVGQVILGSATNYIPGGTSLRSSVFPEAGPITDLGLTGLANGSSIWKWDPSLLVLDHYYKTHGSWSPSTPSLNLGEAVFITSSGNTNWVQTYTTP